MRAEKKVTKSGSITVPVALRRQINLNPGDAVHIETSESGNIVITPKTHACVFCGGRSHEFFKGHPICTQCWEDVKESAGLEKEAR